MKQEQTKQFRVIWLIVFFGFLGISIPYLIFPALFLNPEYTILPAETGEAARALLLGVTLAAYPFGQFIGSPILGSLSDDYGRKKILTTSLWVTAFCYLLTGFAIKWQLVWLLIVSRFLAGLMEGNIAIARAMAADFTALSKHKTFGKINAAASIAYLIGPFLGGLASDKNLWEELTLMTPFYLTCLLFLVLAALSASILKAGGENQVLERRGFFERINIFKRMRILFLDKRLQFLMLVTTAFTLAVDIFYEFAPVHLTMKWGLGPRELISYNAVLCITLALSNGWLASLAASKNVKRQIILGSLGTFPLFLIGISLTDSSYLMLVLFGASGIAIGLAATLLTVKISDAASNAVQGEVLGVQVSLRVLGDAVICPFRRPLLMLSSTLILMGACLLSLMSLGYYAIVTSSHK